MEIQDIEKLAKLARIDLTDTEKQAYLKDIAGILHYVDQIKTTVASVGEERQAGDLRNVTRTDEVKNNTGLYTDSIVAEFPQAEGNYLKVQKIL